MKLLPLLSALLVLVICISPLQAQENSFEELLIQKELNPSLYVEAKKAAINQNMPIEIKLPKGILIDVLKMENGEILYSVITDPLQPVTGGEVLTYNQIQAKFDLSDATINWGNTVSEVPVKEASDTKLLLVPDGTNDNVLSFDAVTGDLLNANFIPPNPGNLSTPKHALLSPYGFISVSDQITDLVQKFDTLGNYIGVFAPAGGVNNTILDNIRGHGYRPNGNLVVTVGGGGNNNAIPEFDADGNYLGNFITAGSGGVSSPFAILFRSNDVLVTASSSNAAHRYDLNGTYLNNLITGVAFPQQIIELPNGNLALAGFSSPSGLRIYTPDGTLLHYFGTVGSLRGVYLLPGGTYLVTNNTGLHEIDSTNGSLIRTIYTSANMQYISYADYSVIPVELTSFTASVINKDVVLNWSTATETNNQGFEIQRKALSLEEGLDETWNNIGFVPGYGTSTEIHNYTFTDGSTQPGSYQYRLKQIDFDGAFNYSDIAEVTIELPTEFSLEQNYPNPFNPTTSIQYAVGKQSFVTLKVYDVLGNEVATLVNEYKEPGMYNVQFTTGQSADGGSRFDIVSGIYFYKLQAGSFIETRKMILIK